MLYLIFNVSGIFILKNYPTLLQNQIYPYTGIILSINKILDY